MWIVTAVPCIRAWTKNILDEPAGGFQATKSSTAAEKTAQQKTYPRCLSVETYSQEQRTVPSIFPANLANLYTFSPTSTHQHGLLERRPPLTLPLPVSQSLPPLAHPTPLLLPQRHLLAPHRRPLRFLLPRINNRLQHRLPRRNTPPPRLRWILPQQLQRALQLPRPRLVRHRLKLLKQQIQLRLVLARPSPEWPRCEAEKVAEGSILLYETASGEGVFPGYHAVDYGWCADEDFEYGWY